MTSPPPPSPTSTSPATSPTPVAQEEFVATTPRCPAQNSTPRNKKAIHRSLAEQRTKEWVLSPSSSASIPRIPPVVPNPQSRAQAESRVLNAVMYEPRCEPQSEPRCEPHTGTNLDFFDFSASNSEGLRGLDGDGDGDLLMSNTNADPDTPMSDVDCLAGEGEGDTVGEEATNVRNQLTSLDLFNAGLLLSTHPNRHVFVCQNPPPPPTPMSMSMSMSSRDLELELRAMLNPQPRTQPRPRDVWAQLIRANALPSLMWYGVGSPVLLRGRRNPIRERGYAG